MSKRIPWRFCLCFLLTVAMGLSGRLMEGQQPAPAPAGVELGFIDTTCVACTDFYGFANGAWLGSAKIPAEFVTWGVNDELDERTRATLHQILDSLAAGHGDTPTDRKLGLFYATCFDSLRAQREGLAPLRSELDRISALRSVEDVRKVSARLQKIGVNAPFTFTSTQDFKDATRVIADASQGGLGLPERDYYTRTDSSSRRLRRVYLAHVARTLTLAGERPAQARSDARRILALETTLARASMPVEKLRDPYAIYHKMAVADLQAITPAFAWGGYLSDVGRPELRELNVEQPGFFRTFDRVLRTQPLGDWRAYLRWHYLDQAAPHLTRELVDEDFSFRSALTGAKALRPRWKRCLGQADNALGEALGQAYVARMFSPQAKQKALELVQNLEAVLRERLAGLEWMGDSTRQQAIVKLEAFANKIGYPDRWRDYSSLEVSDTSFVVNLFRATEFETARQLAKIGKPVDRAEWGMSAPTNNAYYNPSLNEIVFPAGILQPPFFDPDADEASNYGQIGATIGHEMTHGFDDEGRKFDAQGNLRDWWTQVDNKSFDQRAARIVRQYGGYVAVDTLHLNGKLTAGENIADLGGTKIAFAAFERAMAGKSRDRVGGFTPEQRFFIAYAQSWRSIWRPEMLRLIALTNPHSPDRWRVNGVVADMPEFAKAFDCKAGDPLVLSDSLRVQIW